MGFDNIISRIALIALPLLFAITLHEAAHGWLANKLGDKTALMLGRVTLNPVKHIDLWGTIVLPILMLVLSQFTFAFGWAKPVPVTWENLKKPRRDMALVALAGPAANLFMAFLWAGIAKLGLMTLAGEQQGWIADIAQFFVLSGFFGIMINLVLMVLNLIPIPPLDGSRIISSLLPPSLAYHYEKIEPYGIWILLALLFLGILRHILSGPVAYLTMLIRQVFAL